jgi:hypothetical protein
MVLQASVIELDIEKEKLFDEKKGKEQLVF